MMQITRNYQYTIHPVLIDMKHATISNKLVNSYAPRNTHRLYNFLLCYAAAVKYMIVTAGA